MTWEELIEQPFALEEKWRVDTSLGRAILRTFPDLCFGLDIKKVAKKTHKPSNINAKKYFFTFPPCGKRVSVTEKTLFFYKFFVRKNCAFKNPKNLS
ncbi:hypothetical protein [Simkania sp.]|uniref:hypothetical protein n=1 Tax=Simkania sp. TaxID=34094 RepID=UPI003B51B77B